MGLALPQLSKLMDMDNRKNNGGKREGSGRPSKADEQNLTENLHRFIDRDEAIVLLKNMMFDDRDFKAVQLYYRYVYGVPTKTIDVNIDKEQPLFLLDDNNELI
tara:strand:- start:1628 stop:1939 length:312 start_codon:yes stop_codon:yes gene_type:complete